MNLFFMNSRVRLWSCQPDYGRYLFLVCLFVTLSFLSKVSKATKKLKVFYAREMQFLRSWAWFTCLVTGALKIDRSPVQKVKE
jgi:hypothetical protein